jgi:hypothetical protein
VISFNKGDVVFKKSLAVCLATLCFGNLKSEEITPLKDHRINFSLLQVGYEHLKPNNIYTGADVKINSIWNSDKKMKSDHFINTEIRMGYHKQFGERDSLIPYAAIGFSVFHIQKGNEYLRDWSYLAVGTKYFHQFGETFELGLHVKGCRSLQEKHFIGSNTFSRNNLNWSYEIGIPLIWHFGETRNWEFQFEPYYLQIPNVQKTEYMGTRLSFGYRF